MTSNRWVDGPRTRTAVVTQTAHPGEGAITSEANATRGAAVLTGVFGGDHHGVGERGSPVGELAIEIAVHEAVGHSDAQAAELRSELFDPVPGVESRELMVELIEQEGPAGPDGGGPGGELPFGGGGGFRRHACHGRPRH